MTCAAWISVFLLVGLAIVCCIVEYETKKRKPNVRLPRHVSWDRAAKYYGETE